MSDLAPYSSLLHEHARAEMYLIEQAELAEYLANEGVHFASDFPANKPKLTKILFNRISKLDQILDGNGLARFLKGFGDYPKRVNTANIYGK